MGTRCTGAALAAVAALALAAIASGKTVKPVLSSHGIGGIQFGTSKPQAVKEFTSLLGSPSRQFVSNGCGPHYTEVEWGHLYAEFRRGRLAGFRYLHGEWEGRPVQPGADGHGLVPKLVTSQGVSLGSTLAQVRNRYGTLAIIGTDRWQSRDGLIFYISYQVTQPAPANSHITEIKYGTCGDW
jgi:hypothetical protein